VGIGHRVAKLWGFCGLAEALDWPGRPKHGAPNLADLRILMTNPQ